MTGACQGSYADYGGIQPLTPVKNWAISKGYTYQYHGTPRDMIPESAANTISHRMSRMSRIMGTKHIVVGFSAGANFSTLLALRAAQADADILLVIQLDAQMRSSTTNTQANYDELSRDHNISVYGCHSQAYEDGYWRYENLSTPLVGEIIKLIWDESSIYPRPAYSVQIPGVDEHKELAVRFDVFQTYIQPELEKAVQGLQ